MMFFDGIVLKSASSYFNLSEIRTVRTQYDRCRVIYFRDVYKCPSKCLLTLNNVLYWCFDKFMVNYQRDMCLAAVFDG
jgi:hypothetical protein